MSMPDSADLDTDLRARLSPDMLTQSLRPLTNAEEATLAESQLASSGQADATSDLADLETQAPQDQGAAPKRMGLPTRMEDWGELLLLPRPDDPNGVIGLGGQGVVYAYVQRELGREVAVKTVRPDRCSYAAVENLVREACVTARLEHPSIVPVHSLHLADSEGDLPYWVMKRIRGQTLSQHLPSGPEPWGVDRLLEVFTRVLDAVALAHSRGVAHRDLKPDNVLVGEFGEVQVVDWGLAVAMNEEGARGVGHLLKVEAEQQRAKAQDLAAVAAKEHARGHGLASAIPWSYSATDALTRCPRLAGSTALSQIWFDVAYSPDGKTLAACGTYVIKVWDVATGCERFTFVGHTGAITKVCFSPDSRTLASAARDHTARLWDVSTGRQIAVLAGHSDMVRAVCFSPDGQTVASGSNDHTIKLWDAATGTEKATLEGHSKCVSSVCFSPDGRALVSGSHDGTVRLWDVTPATAVTLEQASRMTASRLDGFDVVPLTIHTYDTKADFAPADGFSFQPAANAPSAPNPYRQMRWSDRNPNRWILGARRGEAEAMYRLAMIRERQGQELAARQLHHKVAALTDPKQKEWAHMSRRRLGRMTWLQPWFAAYKRIEVALEDGDIEAAERHYADAKPSGDDAQTLYARRLAARVIKRAAAHYAADAKDEALREYRFAAELDPTALDASNHFRFGWLTGEFVERAKKSASNLGSKRNASAQDRLPSGREH